jgi:hypothetical protein
MNDNLKENEDDWSVEPAKRDRRRLKTALRVALIVAALGAVAFAGVMLFGESLAKRFLSQPMPGLIICDPTVGLKMEMEDCGQAARAAECGQTVSGAEYGGE